MNLLNYTLKNLFFLLEFSINSFLIDKPPKSMILDSENLEGDFLQPSKFI